MLHSLSLSAVLASRLLASPPVPGYLHENLASRALLACLGRFERCGAHAYLLGVWLRRRRRSFVRGKKPSRSSESLYQLPLEALRELLELSLHQAHCACEVSIA